MSEAGSVNMSYGGQLLGASSLGDVQKNTSLIDDVNALIQTLEDEKAQETSTAQSYVSTLKTLRDKLKGRRGDPWAKGFRSKIDGLVSDLNDEISRVRSKYSGLSGAVAALGAGGLAVSKDSALLEKVRTLLDELKAAKKEKRGEASGYAETLSTLVEKLKGHRGKPYAKPFSDRIASLIDELKTARSSVKSKWSLSGPGLGLSRDERLISKVEKLLEELRAARKAANASIIEQAGLTPTTAAATAGTLLTIAGGGYYYFAG